MTQINPRAVAGLYTPLALNNLMMMLSHTLITAGLARTSEPLLALAAYSLSRAVLNVVENPLFTTRQLAVSFAASRGGEARTLRFVTGLALLVTLFLVVLSFGPWGPEVFVRLFDAARPVARESTLALKVYVILPLVIGFRSFQQGLLILRRDTLPIPMATFIRLLVIGVWVIIVPRFPGWGAWSGAAVLVIAMMLEAALVAARVSRRPTTPIDAPTEDDDYGTMFRFFLPLTAMTMVSCAANPMLNAGLARTTDGITAVASFAVGESLARLAISPISALHQVVMVFCRDADSARRLRQLVVGFGALMSLVLLVASVTVVDWLLTHWMGLSGEAVRQAGAVFLVFSALPLIASVRELHWGIMFRWRSTRAIGVCKAINIAVLGLVLVAGLRWFSGQGAVIAAVALIAGELAETIAIVRCQQTEARTRLDWHTGC